MFGTSRLKSRRRKYPNELTRLLGKPSNRGSTPPRTSPPRSTPMRASPRSTPPGQTAPSRESPSRGSPSQGSTLPRQTTPPHRDTPSPPPGAYAAVYLTVYEWVRPLIGLPRTFMRHSAIVIEPDPTINCFQVYHVIGTPGVGLTYDFKSSWANPRDETASLLAMDFVAWIPRNRVAELNAMMRQVRIQLSWSWNCQNWVREVLGKLVQAGLITSQQANSAAAKQHLAVNLPYNGNTPNQQTLD